MGRSSTTKKNEEQPLFHPSHHLQHLKALPTHWFHEFNTFAMAPYSIAIFLPLSASRPRRRPPSSCLQAPPHCTCSKKRRFSPTPTIHKSPSDLQHRPEYNQHVTVISEPPPVRDIKKSTAPHVQNTQRGPCSSAMLLRCPSNARTYLTNKCAISLHYFT